VCVCVGGGGGYFGRVYRWPYVQWSSVRKIEVDRAVFVCLPPMLNFIKICKLVYRIRGSSKSCVKLDLIMAQIRNCPENFNVDF
jgi:hypothetical protein